MKSDRPLVALAFALLAALAITLAIQIYERSEEGKRAEAEYRRVQEEADYARTHFGDADTTRAYRMGEPSVPPDTLYTDSEAK